MHLPVLVVFTPYTGSRQPHPTLTDVVQSAFELQATSAGVKAHVSAAASGSSEKVYSVQVAGKASGISASRMPPVPPPESEPLPALSRPPQPRAQARAIVKVTRAGRIIAFRSKQQARPS